MRVKARLKRAAWWVGASTGFTGLLLLLLDSLWPLPLDRNDIVYSTVVVAHDGTPLRAFADDDGVWRYPTRLQQVSPHYVQALLSYEDRWFYYHPGINPVSLLRASWQMARNGEIVSGGSTLTMQVARLIDPHSRSVGGKLKQMLRALQLEWHYSKDEILELYLNLAPFGGPLQGVQAASYSYLGKNAKELSHAEAALLAVLPQAPSRLRPDRHPQRAEQARNKVLARLAKFGAWSDETVADAKIEKVIRQFHAQPMLAPLFARRLHQSNPQQRLIQTTLDAELQQMLELKLQSYLGQLPQHSSSAILVVDNAGLEVRAYIGSADFLDTQRYGHVDMVQAQRSPGSTLKPFLYGLAMEDYLIHSESLLADAPQSFGGYRPSNFREQFNGPVSVSEALRRSLNVPAVDLLDRYGAKRFVAQLRNGRLGLQLPGHATPNLAVILGGASTNLEALVTAYSALARGGLSGRLRLTPQAPRSERRLLDAGAAWIVRDILENNPRPGLPQRHLNWGASRQVAWKTGTSYGFRDAWAVGVTDRYTIGVWIGRPDGTPVPGYYGAITAAPVLFDIVDSLPGRSLWAQRPPRPASVTETEICWPLGQPLETDNSELCHRRRKAWVLDGVIPATLPDRIQTQWASGRVSYWVNPVTGKWVDVSCGSPQRQAKELARWPTILEPWLNADLRRRSSLPPVDASCSRTPQHTPKPIRIVGLTPNTVLRQATRDGSLPAINLSALGGQGRLYWLINGKLSHHGGLRDVFYHRFDKPGEYEITVLDQQGQYDRVLTKVIR